MSAASPAARCARCLPATAFVSSDPVMLLHRLLGRDDGASDVRDYPRWLDALFSAALAAERAAIALGIGLPFGGSLIVVAARDG